MHPEHRSEREGITADAGARRHETGAAIRGLLESIAGVLGVENVRVIEINCRIAAITTEDAFPLVRAVRVRAAVSSIILCASEISRAIRIDRAGPELRHRVAVVERPPDHRTRH